MSKAKAPTQLNELPKAGDVFEFDYTYRDERTEVVKLIVVDVNDEHVFYKMPNVSVNKVWEWYTSQTHQKIVWEYR